MSYFLGMRGKLSKYRLVRKRRIGLERVSNRLADRTEDPDMCLS